MKKIVAILLVLAMVFGITTMAFAEYVLDKENNGACIKSPCKKLDEYIIKRGLKAVKEWKELRNSTNWERMVVVWEMKIMQVGDSGFMWCYIESPRYSIWLCKIGPQNKPFPLNFHRDDNLVVYGMVVGVEKDGWLIMVPMSIWNEGMK